MVLDLKKLFIGESGTEAFSGELDWSAEKVYGQAPFVAPVRFTGTASNTAGIVRLQYQAVAMLKMPCDRCAEETEQEFSRSFEHVVVTHLDGEDTGALIVAPDYKLNMDELVFADMMLEFPSKFLCRPDCKGICPRCGANLNRTVCRCTDKPIDPRLAALQSLLN